MKKRNSILILSLLSSLTMGSCNFKKDMPNILFIPIDDLRPELGCYGECDVISPNIDYLASQGTLFSNAYCQQSLSNPSRASLLTGLRPDEIRVWDLQTSFRDNVPNVVTLPQYFKNSGYKTIGYGKIFHNTFPDTLSWDVKYHIDGFPFDPDATYAGKENNKIIRERIEDFKKNGIDKRDQLGQWYVKAKSMECVNVNDNAYYDGRQTEAAMEKIKELAQLNKPFFLAVGYYKPHLPFNAPKKYWDMYNRNKIPISQTSCPPKGYPSYALGNSIELRNYIDQTDVPYPYEKEFDKSRQRELKHAYLACVTYIDTQIGKLIQALKDNNLYKNTIIVLWGDHGYKLGDYNCWCKQSNYDVDTRVPFIIIDPRQKRKGIVHTSPVELLDIYPTLCDLAGLPIPETISGKSLKDVMQIEKNSINQYAYSQFLRGRFYSDIDKGVEQMGYAVRSDRYRYVEWYLWDKKSDRALEFLTSELYDHLTDPLETVNVVDQKKYKDVIEIHSQALDRVFASRHNNN